MNTTNSSLLIRIRDIDDDQAWSEFYSLYAELIFRYALARGLQHSDAEDVRSECYEAAVKQIPQFEFDRKKGGFKGWLKTIVNRRVVDLHRRRRALHLDSRELAQMSDPAPDIEELWEAEWKRQHLRHCVERASLVVSKKTAEVFRLLVEDGFSVNQICLQLDLTANQVYKAKSKMLAKVREIMDSEFPPDE